MHDSEQEHSSITGCRVTYESTIFYLSETDRSIIQLQYGQGYTSTQIAALLDISPNTVRQRAWRTRKMLKAVLEKEGIIL